MLDSDGVIKILIDHDWDLEFRVEPHYLEVVLGDGQVQVCHHVSWHEMAQARFDPLESTLKCMVRQIHRHHECAGKDKKLSWQKTSQ